MSRRHPRGRPDGRTNRERGYGAEHRKLRAAWQPRVAAGGVLCARCGRPIVPGTAWDLGHDDIDRSMYRGPEHRRCNRAVAGRRGRGRAKAPTAVDATPITPGDGRPLIRGAQWQRTPDSPVYVIGAYSRQWTPDHPPVDGAMYGTANGNSNESQNEETR